MMTQSALYILAGFLLLAATALLLRRPRPSSATLSGRPTPAAEFFPVHCRYFPQVRHAFSGEDAPYLAGRATPGVYRRWRKGVRRAGRVYLAALRDDFARLNRLARLISLYSPQVKMSQEVRLFRLNMQFQMLYAIVWWRLLLNRPAGDRLEQLASLIGSLGSRLEQAALAPEISSGAITP